MIYCKIQLLYYSTSFAAAAAPRAAGETLFVVMNAVDCCAASRGDRLDIAM